MITRSLLPLLLAFIIVLPAMDAQQRSFNQTISTNHEWYVLHTSKTFMTRELRVYSFSSEPVEVAGQTYFSLQYHVHDDPENIILDPNRLFRESEGKIWGILYDSEEFLLADFSMEVGDTLHRPEFAPFYSEVITNRDTVLLLDGTPRIQLTYCCIFPEGGNSCDQEEEFPFDYQVTEGFIDPLELLKSPCHIWDNVAYHQKLVCYYENGELIYKADGLDDCMTVLSNNDIDRVTGITLYPNPTDQFLQISIDGSIPLQSAEIWSIDGRLLDHRILTDNTLNVQHLQPGIYFLKIRSDIGYHISRFVKN